MRIPISGHPAHLQAAANPGLDPERGAATAPADVRDAVEHCISMLDDGRARVAEPAEDGWRVVSVERGPDGAQTALLVRE